MAINAVHALIYSSKADEVRAFLRDIIGWPHVDDGQGWLIFAMPPAEVAVHPTDGPTSHELYLMCDDIETTMADLGAKGVDFTEPVADRGWGLVTGIKLADGSSLGLYQPRHATAIRA